MSSRSSSTNARDKTNSTTGLPKGLKRAPGKEGVTVNAYARYRGCQVSVVYRALKDGRITRLKDDSLDPIQCDLDWRKNSHATMGPKRKAADDKRRREAAAKLAREVGAKDDPVEVVEDDVDEPDDDMTVAAEPDTLVGSRVKNINIKTAQAELQLKRDLGEVIDRDKSKARVFKLARTFRDSLTNWPARKSAELAAELEVDPRVMLTILEREMRSLLDEMARISIETKED